MVKQKKEKIMKFKRVKFNGNNYYSQTNPYKLWVREDSDNIFITKNRGSKVYWVETTGGFMQSVDSLKEAKEIGYTL
jgi:hypothetical protein|tara:strand:+ start:332 stop:562 length:231 start_codon:yes stop_codon:yes gene_type:complete